MHVLDHDGGLVDASCVAVIAALRHFRRPDVSVQGEEVTIYTPEERVPVPLAMLHYPYCVTMAFFEGGEVVVVDATLKEGMVSEGEVVVTANAQGEVCQIAKLGGVPTDALGLLRCVEVAAVKVREMGRVVDEALERDARRRDKGGVMKELTAENDR